MKFLFPLNGKHIGFGASIQPPFTSPHLNNVRPYDVLENRARGGQRPGTKKLYTDRIGNASLPIVAICQVTTLKE